MESSENRFAWTNGVERFRPHLDEAGRQAAQVVRQFQLTLVLAAGVGVITGLAVAGFEYGTNHILQWVLDQQVWAWAVLPGVGLIAVALLTRIWHDDDSATTDAYVRAYHQRGGRLGLRQLWHKVLGSLLTLGSGNAFGFEGPSMLIGGSVGSVFEERFGSRIRRDDAKVLMVAGAAAGVAAVFKAPLTGLVFALEVPYRSDIARRALLPSLVAAGTAYVTYVALIGTEPLLNTGGSAPFDLKDLGGGLLLGLVCGVLARSGAWTMEWGKALTLNKWARVAIAAVVLVALAPIAHSVLGAPMHLGPSYRAIEWATDPSRTVPVLIGLFALRAVATWVGVVGGGMGGLFIPLVTQGSIVGSIFQKFVDAPNERLFPTVGIAAFLGAGYRTPLAGVAFVAEATGQPGFLVPALIAAATGQLVMGKHSFSAYQHRERQADVEPLGRMPITSIMSPNVDTVEAASTLDEVLTVMLSESRRWAPVVEDSSYVGLLAVSSIAEIPQSDWAEVTAGEIAMRDILPVGPTDTVLDVAERLRASDRGAVAVVASGKVMGLVTMRDLENVEVLLDHLSEDDSTPQNPA
ncbi:MAG: chloride channel protein [Microthrixaceae bacterium]